LKEAELAAELIKWLESQHYEVYQEVQVNRYDRRADIVAVYQRRLWVSETKMTLSLSVIEQATQWKEAAHWVSVCVPASRRGSAARRFAYQVLRKFGVGHIIYDARHGWSQIREMRGDLNRKILPHLRDLLDAHGEEFKGQHPAGSDKGGYWTPFRHTCIDLTRFVCNHPGCTIKEAVEGITHHYASDKGARSNLVGYIRDGIVEGLEVRKDDKGKVRLYWNRDLVKSRRRT